MPDPSAAPVVQPTLSVVVPMFNEAARIAGTIAQLAASPVWQSRHELVFVDDGSRDATLMRLHMALADHGASTPGAPAVQVVQQERNRGKGAAVCAGVAAARGGVIGFVDADLSLNPAEIVRAYDLLLSSQADAVIGERVVATNRKSHLRRLESLVFRRVVELLVPTGVADPQCALKLLRGELAKALYGAVTTDGFAFDVELLAMLHRGRYRVRELPVVWVHQPGSRVRPLRDAAAMLQRVRALRTELADRSVPVVVLEPLPVTAAAMSTAR